MEGMKKSRIKEKLNDSHDVSCREIADLQNTINSLMSENKRKLKEICRIEASFTHTPYRPSNPVGIQKIFLKPLMLKQIDHLMDEQDHLVKKLEEITFRFQQHKHAAELQLEQQTNNYMVLRSAWTKFSSTSINPEEHIDNLNKIVGVVKNNINRMINNQESHLEQNPSFSTEQVPFTFMKKMEKRQQEVERIKLHNEELRSHIYQLECKIDDKNKYIQKLEQRVRESETDLKNTTLGIKTKQCQILDLQSKLKEAAEQKRGSKVKSMNIATIQNVNDQWKVLVQSEHISEKYQTTDKTLNELFQFLKASKTEVKIPSLEFKEQSEEIIIPQLEIPSEFQNERKYGYTDRVNPRFSNKFIPMRTQRKASNKSQLVRTSNSTDMNQDPLPNDLKKFMRTSCRLPLTNTNRKDRLGQFLGETEYKGIDSLR